MDLIDQFCCCLWRGSIATVALQLFVSFMRQVVCNDMIIPVAALCYAAAIERGPTTN